MPFALITVGLILVVTGARNTYQAMGQALVGDFTGPGNFTYWLLAIGSIGALGYVDALRGFSRMFMALIIIAMVLKNGGVFNQVQQALQQGPIAPQAGSTGTTSALGAAIGSTIGSAAVAAVTG
jgi:hypothetical protein